MLAHKWHNRPECTEVLAKYNEWSIDRNIITNHTEFDETLHKLKSYENQVFYQFLSTVIRSSDKITLSLTQKLRKACVKNHAPTASGSIVPLSR